MNNVSIIVKMVCLALNIARILIKYWHFLPRRLKGSDASWEHDEEPPEEVNIVVIKEEITVKLRKL